MTKPLVTVLMNVYNAESFLSEAINSILKQTYRNFEFVIIDDGSTDGSLAIIKDFKRKDARISYISRENKGVPKSCNEGISLAKGKYIARQDADDISDHTRLEKQVNFLDKNPSIDMVGSNFKGLRLNGETAFETDMFTHPDDLKFAIVFTNQFAHGSVMAKKSLLDKVNGYRDISIVHDYDLWIRISHVAHMANLKESLYTWRYHDSSLSNTNFDHTTDQAHKIRMEAFEYFKNHRTKYRIWSLHPFSTNSPFKYCNEKSRIYRNMALLYSHDGLRRYAVSPLFGAILIAPWNRKNYQHLLTILFKRNAISTLRYE